MIMRSPFLVLLALTGASALAPVVHAQVVVPNGLATVEGNDSNVNPFSISPPVRYQQVYVGKELQSGWITAISFRLDGAGPAFAPVIYDGVQLTLSSTFAGPDSLSSTLNDNLGGDAAVILQGSVSFSSTAAGDPNPFDITLSAQSPFFFDPQGGSNLLVELVVGSLPGASIVSPLDAQYQVGDSVGRAFCQGAVDCETADFTPDTVGLVTSFTMAIFADGFESGHTDAWSASVSNSGDLTELQCINSAESTLILVGEMTGEYMCRPSEGSCEPGFRQRTDTEESCEAKKGCVFIPGFCYCSPDLVCFCGGGPPPQCVEGS